jgi:hypothetical protein
MSDLPPNIREFNVIVGLIFNQLYEVFPVIPQLQKYSESKAPIGADTSCLPVEASQKC